MLVSPCPRYVWKGLKGDLWRTALTAKSIFLPPSFASVLSLPPASSIGLRRAPSDPVFFSPAALCIAVSRSKTVPAGSKVITEPASQPESSKRLHNFFRGISTPWSLCIILRNRRKTNERNGSIECHWKKKRKEKNPNAISIDRMKKCIDCLQVRRSVDAWPMFPRRPYRNDIEPRGTEKKSVHRLCSHKNEKKAAYQPPGF